MEPAKDIYHKEEPPVPPRRRRSGRSIPVSGPVTPPSSQTSSGVQRMGTVVSPVDIARQHLQMQPQQHLRRRRRRDSSRDNQKVNKLIWVLLSLVVAAYAVLLVGSVVKSRLFKTPPKTEAKGPVKPAMPAAEPALVETNLFFVESGLPIAERVQKWSKGARLMDEADNLLNSGRYPLAREKLIEAQTLVPNAVDRMNGLAKVYLSERKFAEAAKLLLRVVESDPDNPEARVNLARSLKETGRSVDALAVADWICALDNYSEDGHEIAAEAALQLGDPARAAEHLRKLSNLKSGDLTVRHNLGIALMRQGSLAEARKTFEDILREDEQHSMAHYNLAVCETRQGRPADVVATLGVASARLGESFVWSWLGSAEFDPVRTNADFVAFERRLGTSAQATNRSATAVH